MSGQLQTTVLTCTYNMAGTLRRAIDSVLAQTVKNFEYLIIDDGSTDETQELLENYRHDGRIRFIRFESNQGLTFCRNFALQKCKGDILSIVDADDFITADKLEKHHEIFEKHPDVAVVWGSALVSKGEQDESQWRLVPEKGYTYGWDIASSYKVVHSASSWRVRAVQAVGGYDPQYTEAEAVDLFLRLGDRYEQKFIQDVVCFKSIDESKGFRPYLKKHGSELSRKLILNTLRRRYQLERGQLFNRLSHSTD